MPLPTQVFPAAPLHCALHPFCFRTRSTPS